MIMIVQLNCSMSYCKIINEVIPSSTGELEYSADSVPVSISDLRKVNSKLIELKYEKEINKQLKETINNDSIIIQGVTQRYNSAMLNHEKELKKVKKERNIYCIVSIIVTVLLGVSIVK